LKNAVIPCHRVRECVARNQCGKKWAARSPTERARWRSDKQKQINKGNWNIIEMKHWMVALKYRGNGCQETITFTKRRDMWNREMLPGNQSESQRRKRTEDLRDKDDVFSAHPVRQMASRQRKRHHGKGDGQAYEAERSRRMCARVNLPFHRNREHQSARDRE